MEKLIDLGVREFLEEIKRVDATKSDILTELRQIIFDVFPKTDERIMYGGIVFFFNNEMFCGIFSYKKHVSIEFSQGFLMKDPHNFLEGRGKYRRHLKIKTRDEIVKKNLPFFVQQAV